MKNEHYRIGGLFITSFGSMIALASMGVVIGLISLAFIIGGTYLIVSR